VNEDWLTALHEVYEALNEKALRPIVIGGRALLLLCPPQDTHDLDLASRLGAVSRVTYDLDLALIGSKSHLHVAYEILTRQLDFTWNGDNPFRYQRGEGDSEIVVDLVAAQQPPDRTEEWPMHWILPIVAGLPPIEIDGLRVMHPAGLVVLKATASRSDPRRVGKDYLDLAQLALRDRDGVARIALTSLIPKLQKSRHARIAVSALRLVRLAFADRDSSGTVRAARELSARVFPTPAIVEADGIRSLVSAAVSRLLEGVPD
jgi:hypothetical protein